MTKPVNCPDPETFEQLFSGELATDARAAIADHAAVCRDCELVDLLLDSGALATTAGVTVSTPTSVRVRSLVDLRAWRPRHGPPSS